MGDIQLISQTLHPLRKDVIMATKINGVCQPLAI